MGIQFFGEYLIDRWVITPQQLLEALDLQEYRNLKFGALAVQRGYLSEDDVARISTQQIGQDRRFGDLAVEMGLMTEAQVGEILTLQKNNYLYLGEALLELGHLTEDILERELTIFKEEQSRYGSEAVVVPEWLGARPAIEACVDLTRKMFIRVAGLLIKTGPPEVYRDGQSPPDGQGCSTTVQVRFDGSVDIRFLLGVSHDVAVAIASRILKEDASGESLDLVEDAVREFCNFICGNAAARLAQQGVDTGVLPPESLSQLPRPENGSCLVRYPVHMAEGRVELDFIVPLQRIAAARNAEGRPAPA
ncbi:MAG: chemotaxis protein CheX [Deltaproteobacteria bacterium]|nr:chemotaxis protein CheX [Deltaproteobacteria bacterium]